MSGIKRARFNDFTGVRFGRLVAIEPTEERWNRKVVWRCKCDCGGEVLAPSALLTIKNIQSCGYLQRESRITHGLTGTKEYKCLTEARRREATVKRTPVWADTEKLSEFYANCPEGMTVDHVLPLRGKLISGLHIPENLQYLTRTDNGHKHNKFTPYIESRA